MFFWRVVRLAIIKTLMLKNFKSFRKAEIPFAQGFTAIAGANASGKSNCLDALLFAMGITSLRLLRASKLTDLVNHDSKEGYAKVELALTDNNGKEIILTRMIDRQGRSVYRLDGKRKTLNEIQSLLLEIGVNPNGHNIVVQGDITRVIEMNAKQRREIIEEVAGLQEFEEKKEEALKKLEKVEQRVKDAQIVLGEREAYLAQIEKDRDNALRYNALQLETKRSKATILSEEIKIVKRDVENARQRMEKLQKEIEDRRGERNRLHEEETRLEQKVEEATQKLIEASQKTYSSFGKELEQKKGHLNLLRERMESRKELVQQKKKRIVEIAEEAESTEKISREKEEELRKAMQEIEEAERSLSEIMGAIDSRSPAYEKKKSAAKASEARLAEANAEIDSLREKMHAVSIARNSLEKEQGISARRLEELEIRLKKLVERDAQRKEAEKRARELGAKGPLERLEAKEKQLEKIVSELHTMRGRAEGVEEALGTISKSGPECPTCEKPLEAGMKQGLLRKKKLEAAALKEKIGGLQEEKKRVEEEKNRLAAEEKELAEAGHFMRSFHGLLEELQKTREEISGLKETVGSGKAEKLLKEENELAKKIGEMLREKSGLEEKVLEFRQSGPNAEVQQLVSRLQELNQRKSEKQRVAARLGAEIEHGMRQRAESLAAEKKAAEKEIAEIEKGIGETGRELAETEKEAGRIEAEMEKSSAASRLIEEEKARLTAKTEAISQKSEQLAKKIEAREKELNEASIENSRNEVRAMDLEEEFREYSPVETLKEAALGELKKRIPEIEKEIEKLGAINMKSLENFESFRKEVEEVREKTAKLDEERKAVLEMIDKIEVRKLNVFMECFSHVSAKFSELYYRFFEGKGLLELSDRLNPLEGGLLIQAKYKEDTMKSIDAMSGGEKSLTALAFLFAIQSFEPAPFYIFDEVDAALDKENSVKVGNMLKEQSKASQFIVISHNDAVINQADQIIGVAINRQKSSVIGLRLRKQGGEAMQEAQAEAGSKANA